MTLVASILLLDITIKLLLVLFVIICLGIILLVLMQRPKQEGLGAAFGGGVTDQVFGARTTNVLQRGTAILGTGFFVLALALSLLISYRHQGTSMAKEPAEKAPVVAPVVPAEQPQPKSLSEELPLESTSETPATSIETPATSIETPATSIETPATSIETPATPAQPASAETSPPAENPADQ